MARTAKPWWRADRREWFVWFRGRQVRLGVRDPADRPAAEAALAQLREGLPVIVPAIAGDPVRRAVALARELLAGLRELPELDNRERRAMQLRLLLIDLEPLLEPDGSPTDIPPRRVLV